VITTLKVGGAERFVVRLANELCHTLRVEIWVLCGMEDRPLLATIDERVHVRLNSKLRSHPGRIVWTTRQLRRVRPRVVQSLLWEADFVCAIASWLTGYRRLFVSERGDRWTTGPRQRLLDRTLVFPIARGAIANSSAAERSLVTSGWRRGEIAVIHNGLPPIAPQRESCEVREALDIPEDAKIVGMVSRMVWEKGWLQLVEASAVIHRNRPETLFIAVGGGRDSAIVHKAVEDRSLSKAWRFCGEVENPADYVQLFDVACLPSMRGDGEACPNALLEYMAMGKAIVASDVGGIPDLVDPRGSHAGVLVKPGDVDQLTHEIDALLEYPDRRQTMSANALRRSRDFTIARVARQYVGAWGLS
jgi:glycosyltransferase involved in cell wall biosynthesis